MIIDADHPQKATDADKEGQDYSGASKSIVRLSVREKPALISGPFKLCLSGVHLDGGNAPHQWL
jgi:hypothetical protein